MPSRKKKYEQVGERMKKCKRKRNKKGRIQG
jgi:hypothetical protein